MNKMLLLVIVKFIFVFMTARSLAEQPSFDSIIKLVESGNSEELRSLIQSHPRAIHISNSKGLPLIHRAVMTDKVEMVLILIEAGAKLDAIDELHRTPLHVAAGWSTFEMVEILLNKGANAKSKTKTGDTPLDFANNNFYQDKKVEMEKIKAFLNSKGIHMSEGDNERQKLITEVEENIASRPDKGPKPKQSVLDGSVGLVKVYVREMTKDPSPSFEEWSKVSSLGDKWAVRVKFTYKNHIGVPRQDNRWFYIVGETVVATKSAQ